MKMSLSPSILFQLFIFTFFLHANFYCSGVSSEGCIYRDKPPLPPQLFSYWGCYGCYNYLQRYKPNQRINATLSCWQGNFPYHCYVNQNNQTIYFDYNDPLMTGDIADTLLSQQDIDKWIQCCVAADDCCEKHQRENGVIADFEKKGVDWDDTKERVERLLKRGEYRGVYWGDPHNIDDWGGMEGEEETWKEEGNNVTRCPAMWDGWTCWGSAAPETLVQGDCPNYIYSNSGPSCDFRSEKQCLSDGTWNVKTDYTTCSVAPLLRVRHTYHVIILAVSIATSIPAVIIFFSFRKLQNTRVALHRNLLLAIMLRNTLVILNKSLVVLDDLWAPDAASSEMAAHSVWCRVLSALERFATNGVFALMTLESVYLHRIIAAAFRGQPDMRPYYALAAVLCGVTAGTWAGLMASSNDYFCWVVDLKGLGLQWINDSLRVLLLVINLVLLVDIVRVLLTTLRKVESVNSSRIRRTAKATVMLVPVFGVQFLFTAVRPSTRDCTAEQAYYLVSYALDGLQGLMVATLYCYLNQEVRQLLRAAWITKFGGRSGAPRPSFVTDVTVLRSRSSLSGPSSSKT